MITDKEIFERVKTHLLKQSERSADWIASCYRLRLFNGGEIRCAIGCLITDEFYEESLEQKRVTHADVLKAVALSIGVKLDGDSPTMNMLDRLQLMHDLASPSDWKGELKGMETFFNPEGEYRG